MKYNNLLVLFVLVVTMGCGGEKNIPKPVEIWQDTPSRTTTKIKIKTDLSQDKLLETCIARLTRGGFKINQDQGMNPLTTEIKKYETYNVRFFVSFEDGSAIFYGQYGSPGINDIAMGTGNIAWNEITGGGGKGWQLLDIVTVIPNSTKLYNKIE